MIHEGWQRKLSAWSKKTGAGMNRLAPSEAKVITHCGDLQDYHCTYCRLVDEFLFHFYMLKRFTDAGPERASGSEMDEQRKQQMAYQYLCHLEEAKVCVGAKLAVVTS